MLSIQPIKYAPGNVSKMQKVAFKGEDKANNGKFDFSQGAKQFGKGVMSPITSIFSSFENFAVTAGIATAGVALVRKVKAAGPILVAIGTAFGVFQIGNGIAKLIKAKDGDAKEKALFHTGSGVGTIGLSILTSKPILRNSGLIDDAVAIKNSTPKSYIESFKILGKSTKETYAQTIGKLDDIDGIWANIIKNKGKLADIKNGTIKMEPAVKSTVAGADEGIGTMTLVMDTNTKKEFGEKRA